MPPQDIDKWDIDREFFLIKILSVLVSSNGNEQQAVAARVKSDIKY